MLVNIDLRSTFVFYLDPKILLDARGGGGVIGFEALGPGFTGPRRCATKKSF